jgi:glucose-6-phosphate 1-dehydrogenase
MEAPSSFGEREFRDRKVEMLRAVRRPSEEEVATETIRARYTAGRVGGEAVPNYVDEEGVDASRETETFTSVTFHVDNARWEGVPFVLRTGKAMRRDRHEIVVRFRPVPHWAFRDESPEPNVLRLGLDPDRLEMGVNINGPKGPFELDRACMDIELAPPKVTAYGRVLLDILEGDSTLSIRGDEAEESWRIVEPILEGWQAGLAPMREYEAGGDGP